RLGPPLTSSHRAPRQPFEAPSRLFSPWSSRGRDGRWADGGGSAGRMVRRSAHTAVDQGHHIAVAAPQWQPGSDIGYSGTIDPILQEVAQRVVGEPLDPWFRRDVTGPAGVEVFLVFLELPKAELGRLATAIRRDGTEWHVPRWWPENA